LNLGHVLHERSVSLEFCVADTGIEALADLVPWPHLSDLPHEERTSGSAGAEGTDGLERRAESVSAYHLGVMIALRRLTRRTSDVVHEYEPVLHDVTWRAKEPLACGNGTSVERLSKPNSREGFPIGVSRALADELHAWRQTLPPRLQWSDDRKFDSIETGSPSVAHIGVFNLAKNTEPHEIDHNVDVVVAHLRTSYYQASFLLYRPFVYKAVHQPGLMTRTDRKYCAYAVQTACHWPMSLAPPENKIRLLPHLFSWTQNFLAILVILKFCSGEGPLNDICQENDVPEEYIRDNVVSMRTWLEDVGQMDGIAQGGLRVFL
jgi:hypothetical protein